MNPVGDEFSWMLVTLLGGAELLPHATRRSTAID